MSFHRNQRKIWLSSKFLAENCSLARFWQQNCYLAFFWLNERLYCKILAKRVIKQHSGQKVSFHKNQGEIWLWSKTLAENWYLVRFWQNQRVSCKTLTKMVILENSDRNNGYLAVHWRKMVTCKILAEKLLSCNILAEWTFMLQDSGEKNCYRASFWQKSVISQESGRNSVIEQDFGEKLLSCKILRDWTDILHDPDKKGFFGQFWQKEWLSCVNLPKNG